MNEDETRDDGFREYADALDRLVPQEGDAAKRRRVAQGLLDNIESLYARAGVNPPAWVGGLRTERK